MTTFIGRSIRNICAYLVLAALMMAQPLMAAPYAEIVMDARSGEVLYEKNADTRLHPASLTKMMTLYIVFQEIEAGRLSLDTKVTVSAHAASQPPSKLGLKKGQKIAVRYLIRAAAVKSANDAATALGEHIGGSEAAFAKRMTKTAKALGMRNSTFRNAHGLTTEGHMSTARDMTILGRHLFYDFPQYYNIFSRRTADAGMAKVTNSNSRFLDQYEGADGIKTGYTVAAGFNLTASAKHGNVRLIATIFGSTSTPTRTGQMKALMDKGFGLARNNVREKKPEAAPLPAEDLIASAGMTDDVPGGVGKTISVSGEVTRSLRPRANPGHQAQAVAVAVATAPDVPAVPDAMADAIAMGVESALAEATAPPPPEGTLEAQVAALESPALIEDTTEEAEVALAADAPVQPDGLDAPAGSLEAQAGALAAAPAGTLEEQSAAFAETLADPAMAGLRPMARPEVAAEAPAVVAEVAPEVVPEMVAPVAAPPETVSPAVEVAETAGSLEAQAAALAALPAEAPLPLVTEVQEAVAVAEVIPEAAIPPDPDRSAPIFEPVEMAQATPEEAEELVVVSKSTSGGRAWGVNVGAYTSQSEAERALLKTSLAESATLNVGAKKITTSGGKYRASFLGLTEDQADLACRRLRARGMECEAIGPG